MPDRLAKVSLPETEKPRRARPQAPRLLHSKAFYRLVARKVPETVIRPALSELKEGGAESAAKVFTSKMVAYAEEALVSSRSAGLAEERQALSDRFSAG